MFIDSYDTLQTYKNYVESRIAYIIPLLQDSRLHPCNNDVISLYVFCDDREFILPYKHPESIYSEYTLEDILCAHQNYFLGTDILKYKGVTTKCSELELLHYLNTSTELEYDDPSVTYHYRRLYNNFYKVGYLQPLNTFISYAKDIIGIISRQHSCGESFYNEVLLNSFHKIESNGIYINVGDFIAQHGSPINLIDDRVYTKYRFTTATGRPSNSFGGINFAALNKQDDTRRCVVSRYSGGKLVEIDFKAYHPHIIAWLCDYDFGSEDVYEHLAKHYYNNQQPSEEQIQLSKKTTFNQLYGGIRDVYKHIPFFTKADSFSSRLYNEYLDNGYVVSQVSGRRLYVKSTNQPKLFNYYIQMTETELNGKLLQKLLPTINSEHCLPILYTYDALLFDTKQDYVTDLIAKINSNIPKEFPISIKIGDNYKEMINYECSTTLHVYDNR